MYSIKPKNKPIYPLIPNSRKSKPKKLIDNLNLNGSTYLSVRFGSIHVHLIVNIKKVLKYAVNIQNQSNKRERTIKSIKPE